MKKLTAILLFLLTNIGFAQQKPHRPGDELKSLNWDVIGTVKFELTEKNELLPIYSSTINRFKDAEFDLTGYLIPIKSAKKQQKFLLATLPINQCYFCGQNGVPIMIMVELNSPVDFTDKPIRVKGILKLANTNASYQPPVSITNAKVIS
ncbi:hypothetical protein [Pedobacter sp. CFBP9032]|uniref:hypothetical protein n=1 Tax=Pedobacter sp. CFBP9032 TaxID=3096539 RepID=UPI002A6A7B3D|nr:hypothetical protein [Pedobacter sp. CFBP9032]MDY0904065.1 hypothetical protein [Pedobacter sp. CFBP9032]